MKENGGGFVVCAAILLQPQHKVTSHFGSALKGKKVFFLRLQMYFLVVLVNNMTLVLTTVSNLVFPSQG